MTIHFFTRGDIRAADSRQRAFLIAEKLSARGMNTVIHRPPAILVSETPWPQKLSLIIELVRSLSSVRKGDILFLQRTVSNKYFFAVMVAYLLLFRRKMIFDFCDPIYVFNPIKTKILTRMADAVFVSTHGQEEWAKCYNSNTHLIHISLDTSIYARFTKDYRVSGEPPVIGWVGTARDHMSGLQILARAFKELLEEMGTPLQFVLIGTFGDKRVHDLFDIPGLQTQFVDRLNYADSESAPREIQKFDIGVVPQIHTNEWHKAKTSMKILEYMACGVPTIASASGELPYIIEDGINGYLAANEEEWVEKLKLLLGDHALREQLGRAGQKTVQERYSFDAIVPRIVQVIHALS